MQNKPPLRYVSINQAVYAEVELYFLGKGVELPAEWTQLIAIALYPGQVVAFTWQCGWQLDPAGKKIPLTATEIPKKKELEAFVVCYARQPDLTLEILTLARKWFKEFQRDDTKTARVRHFLLHYPNVIKERGEFRLPRVGDGPNSVHVSVHSLQDDDIARLLFDAKQIGVTAIVKKVRQSLSYAYDARGKPYSFPKGKLHKNLA